MYLMQHFQGSKWNYRQPEGYDTYDAVDVMIMSSDRLGSNGLLEAQAIQLIAGHDNGVVGRISIDTFARIADAGFKDTGWGPMRPCVDQVPASVVPGAAALTLCWLTSSGARTEPAGVKDEAKAAHLFSWCWTRPWA